MEDDLEDLDYELTGEEEFDKPSCSTADQPQSDDEQLPLSDDEQPQCTRLKCK